MKINIILLGFVSIALVAAVPFGPQGCVDLSKSDESTCVLRTNCGGVDTSKFEFAFDCVSSAGSVQKHSFGFGGFDDNEEYDTAVKCKECGIPKQAEIKTTAKQQVMAVGVQSSQSAEKAKKEEEEKKEEKEAEKTEEAKEEKKEEKKEEVNLTPPADAKIAKFGPDNCVSTWRDEKTAHCIVKTDCQGKNTTEYMFGVICDGSNGPVRHLFGKDSFEAVESFDTLIPCTECLALDAIPEDVELAQEINNLGDSIKGMKADMTELTDDVTKLQNKVGLKEEKKEEDKKEEEKKEEEKKEEEKKEGEEKEEEKDGEEKADEDKGEDAKEDEAAEDKKDESSEDKKVFFMKKHDKDVADDSDDSDEDQNNGLSDNDIDEAGSFHKENKLRGHGAHKKRRKAHRVRKHRHHVQEQEDADSEDDDADSDDQEHHASLKRKKKNKAFRSEKSEETKSDADSNDNSSESSDTNDASDTKEVASDDDSTSTDKDDSDSDSTDSDTDN